MTVGAFVEASWTYTVGELEPCALATRTSGSVGLVARIGHPKGFDPVRGYCWRSLPSVAIEPKLLVVPLQSCANHRRPPASARCVAPEGRGDRDAVHLGERRSVD
jgi:hypothetical protein